ncbi:MAG: translation initiation factor [Anaerocolumna sp.]|jgi:translation initiation factor IF-2|nr:translation initiation factor [Anaerocolumna sp.]
MAKIKVYELAKEIDKQSKDIINYLKNQGVEVKSHMSNVEDDQVSLVKKYFSNQGKPAAVQTTEIKAESSKDSQVKPVTHQQNSSNQRYQGQSNQGNSQGNNGQGYSNQNSYHQGNNNQGNYNRPYNNNNSQDQRQTGQGGQNRPSNYQNNRPNNRPQNGQQGQRPMNENGQNRSTQGNYNQNRPQGQNRPDGANNQSGNRPYNNQSNGQYRQNRPYNQDGQNRPYNQDGGNRPMNQDRPNRPYNQDGGNRSYNQDGGNRSYNQDGGNRSYNQDGGNRSYNQDGGNRNNSGQQGRPNYGDRPQNGNRPYNNSGNQGNRPGQSGGYNNNRNGQTGGYNNNRPGQSGGYNNNRPGQQRNNDGTGGGYQNRGYNGGGFNKDFGMNKDDKDADVRRSRPAASKTGDTKKFDAPIGMSRSDSVNNRNSRVNKNVKGTKNNYGRKEVDVDNLLEEKIVTKKGQFIKPKPIQAPEVKEDDVKTITIPEILTIKELADKMKLPSSALVKKLFLAGKMVSINQEITFEEAEEIAIEYEIIAEREVVINAVEELLKEDEENPDDLEKRPPVVCVMGHVDHGKTSLLDAIREANVTSHEAGGITQHIGAYVVEVNGEKITFLDTPGHEAFTSMRMRGAQSTDIAILVVAADDGVMPQTVEAISHAKAAGIQIIVAINKIDKPSANIERVKQELVEYGLIAEDWGGDTVFVPVSAHTKEGIDQLLDMIILTSEMVELKANPNRKARGIVIEAQLDKGRGPVATVLVQKGTLHVGDTLAIGSSYGKVRAMMDDKGRRVKEATPSTPVEILGLNEVPDAGEIVMATDNEKEARAISEAYISQGKEKLLSDTKAKLSLDGLFSQIKAGNIKELNIIIKADVQGSVEAMKQSLLKLSNEEVAIRVIHGGVGAINESDVTLAITSNAIIIGFNVRPDNTAKETADREKVDLRLYRVIYNAIDDIEAAMKGMLDPIFEEKVIGHAEIRQVFKASGLGTIAGSYVMDGKIQRGCSARITREGKLIFEGALASVKRFKDDVKEVASGYECGLVFEKFNDLQEFDMVELYIMQEVPR